MSPGDTTAIVSWTPPPNSAASLSGYTVVLTVDAYSDFFSDFYGSSRSFASSGTVNAMLLTGLTNGVSYTVEVFALSASGTSVASNVVTFVTVLGNQVQTDPNPSGPPPVVERTFIWPTYGSPTYTPANAKLPDQPQSPSMHHSSQACGRRPARPGSDPRRKRPDALPGGHGHRGDPADHAQPGGIYLNDFDLGYPTVREVITNWPNAHGTIDETKWYADRAVSLALTCTDSVDSSGVYQSASAWADTLRRRGPCSGAPIRYRVSVRSGSGDPSRHRAHLASSPPPSSAAGPSSGTPRRSPSAGKASDPFL